MLKCTPLSCHEPWFAINAIDDPKLETQKKAGGPEAAGSRTESERRAPSPGERAAEGGRKRGRATPEEPAPA